MICLLVLPYLIIWLPCTMILSCNFEVEAVTNTERCKEDLLNENGYMVSPNKAQLKQMFPQANASDDISCTWRVLPQPGIIKLLFPKLEMGIANRANQCNSLLSLTIVDRNAISSGHPMETEVCNSKLPLTYYSKGPSLEVVLKGQLLHPSYDNYSFSAVYNTLVTSTVASTTCDPCGGTINTESGMIHSPRYPGLYPGNCDCHWSMYVRKGYIIKFKFWAFSLEPREDSTCHDYIAIYDGSSFSSKLLGKFCGNQNPGSLRTTSNKAFVHFHSDGTRSSTGFEVMYESARDEEDLTSLRSIAAILGGVSFGIFIFLLICSVVYKRYMSNGDRRDTCPPAGPENDYLDAVQAAAPPSYQTVMADPEHYPRTPEITPASSPVVTPSLLRRSIVHPSPLIHHTSHPLDSLEEVDNNGVETPPPPYPGNVQEIFDNKNLIDDVPPPPTYEMVSDNDEIDDSLQTWAPIESEVDFMVSSSLARPTVDIDESVELPSNTTSTTTQVTSCDSDSNLSSERRETDQLSNRGGAISRRQSDESLCLQCIEDSGALSVTQCESINGDLRGSYSLLRTGASDSSPHCSHRGVSFRRRRKDSNRGKGRMQSSDIREIHGKKSESRPRGYTERSLSVPSLVSDHSDCVASHIFNPRRSLGTFRHFFSRRNHSHNGNRVQPNSGESEQSHSFEQPTQTGSPRNRNRILYIGDELSGSSHL